MAGDSFEMDIMNVLKEAPNAAMAQAALVTVLYTICVADGWSKNEALSVIDEQWDRLDKSKFAEKLREIVK